MSGISDNHATLSRGRQWLDIPTKRPSDSFSGFVESYLLRYCKAINSIHLIPSQEPTKCCSPPPASRTDGRQTYEECSHDCQIPQIPQADSRVPFHKVTSAHQLLASETNLQPSIDNQARALYWLDNEMTQRSKTGPITQDQDKLMVQVKQLFASVATVESFLATVKMEANTHKNDLSQSGNRESLHTQRTRQDFSSHNQSHSLEFKSLARKISLHCRTWRRLSDRLLPLLRREQDSESLQQWVEVIRLSSYLIHLLKENESMLEDADTALLEALAHVEAVLNRLKLRFRRRYDELKKKDGLTQAIFEFPNNFRHLCTTMPWTIAPALLILWVVCWMFFGSPSPSHKKPVAAGPVTSPSPDFYDFLGGYPSTDTSGKFHVHYIHSLSNPC
jgi:hypothetical protein